MAEHLRAADADTAALQARLDALESETHSLREVLTERLNQNLCLLVRNKVNGKARDSRHGDLTKGTCAICRLNGADADVRLRPTLGQQPRRR